MGSAHSVSLQIYVFPFTCFAFSLFFCHFVFSSSSLPPSRAPHCAASSRSVSPNWRGRDRSSVSVAGKGLAPRSMWPLTGLACNLLTRISTTVRRVGEGRFFFVSPPLSSFPLILFCLALCTAIACNCTRGVLALSCAEFRGRIGPTAKPRTMPARATSGMSARRQKTRGQLHGNGKLFAPPSSFVFERRARRVSSNRAVVVRGRRWKDTAAKETNAGQKRNL